MRIGLLDVDGHAKKNKWGATIYPHSQPFRDTITPNTPPQWQIDMARWTNHIATFKNTDFKEYSPRINFKCSTYFNQQK